MYLRAALLAVIVAYGVRRHINSWIAADHYRQVYNHQPGACELVEGIDYGSEDMQALPNGKVFITSGFPKWPMDLDAPDFKHRKGQIFLLDVTSQNRVPLSLPISEGFDSTKLHPHGLSIWQDQRSGYVYLYVVNHLAGYDNIEKFRYDEKSEALEYIKSFHDENMRLVNDVVVVGEDQFFYTNFHYYTKYPGITFELMTGMAWGSVVYFDGRNSKIVLSGKFGANGINVSPDRRFVYVAYPFLKKMEVNKWNKDYSLTLLETIPLQTGIDNIDVDPVTGYLYLGCHPVIWRLINYIYDPVHHYAPSQILRLHMKDGKLEDMTELYSNDGSVISGSSVGIYAEKQLLIGTVYHKMLRCNVEYEM